MTLTEALVGVRWVKPQWSTEESELNRVAVEEGITMQQMKPVFESGEMKELDDAWWADLENTDSFQVVSMNDATTLAAQYNRNVSRIVSGMKTGKPMQAPIVAVRPDEFGSTTLVSGNTRLMVARALGVRPMVWEIVLPEPAATQERF